MGADDPYQGPMRRSHPVGADEIFDRPPDNIWQRHYHSRPEASQPESRVEYVGRAFTFALQKYVSDEAKKLVPKSWEELAQALLPELIHQLKIVAISAGIGMGLGGIAGTFVFPGVGTGAGMLVGAKLGASVAFLFLNFYGLVEIVKMAPDLLKKIAEILGDSLASGIKTAWNSRGDHGQIDLAARQLAPGLAMILAFLLVAAFILVVKRGSAALQKSKLIQNPKVSGWLAKIPKIMVLNEAARLSGWHPEALRRLSQICKSEKKVRIYRTRKPGALQYEARPGYRPKPMDVKFKSQSSGPHNGLVMIPEKLDALPLDQQKELQILLGKGYKLEKTGANDGLTYLVDPKGNKLYSDIDPMGIYRQVERGGFVRSPDAPGDMNVKLGRRIWDDPLMEQASGFGAQDHFWKKKADGTFEMRADPELRAQLGGKFDDKTLMDMGAQVRKMALDPRPNEKFLVATPDGNFYMMDVQQLQDFYKVMGVWWPYGN